MPQPPALCLLPPSSSTPTTSLACPDDPETHALWGRGEETTRGTINLNRPAVVLVHPLSAGNWCASSAAGGDWTSSQRINTFTAVTGHAPAPDWQAHRPGREGQPRDSEARLTSTAERLREHQALNRDCRRAPCRRAEVLVQS